MNTELEAKIDEILTRGVAEVIDKEHLKKRLMSGEKLRVKLGIDPTSPNLHLGRAISLLKMKDLQELGHKAIFIIGDFTGVIGDASDKESERPMIDPATVEKNLATYNKQAGKFLDMSQAEVHYNSEWLGKLGYKEIAEQANVFSVAEFNARENVKVRLQKGARVSLREILYPLMQGYDSVMVKADLELGGTDQRFNLLAGRELQKHYRQDPQDILMVNLVEGTDGRKMSSSWGNTINILDEPNDMFGKVMSIPDNLIIKYFIHCTRTPLESMKKMEKDMATGKLNPRDAKLCLAHDIVKIYHGEEKALAAQKYFVDTFSKKEMPESVTECLVEAENIKLTEFLVQGGQAKSLSDARRKIEQGGVEIDGKKVENRQLMLDKKYDGKVFKVGKFGFVKIKFK
ncbi:MAG: tyrosine--tRNA ligase [Candidatus Moranbacteria bacterium CG_4_9_14_3_um_filter_42_9]|nr:MAG: tyrosine--tRNA ligase [Candidatus Moranbacteria bacterium CG_4_9_14_3_um_filter_42_9]